MPADWPVCMDEYIWAILPSRIRLRIAGVPIMISCAATRPPPVRLSRVCEITARSDSDSIERTMSFFLARKHIDHPIDGLGGRAGVQRAEHQVAGLGGGQRQPNGLQVAHFADQHDIRVLAQRRTQRFTESEGVAFDFALVDQATFRLMNEFDRILDRYDVIGTIVIAVVHHAGQRCRRLARPGRGR